jgi:hypothetical protein
MNNLISVITIITALTITSCGGGGQSGDKTPIDNKYAGIWYDDENDTYLKILDSGVASLYICTLHEGYQENPGIYAEVINDELNVTEEQSSYVYSLQIQNQNLLLSSTNVSLALTMVDSIPTICENDAIEIVYLSPLEVYEGELTTFIVNYEYRLTSAENGEIGVGFTSDASGAYLISEENTLDVDSTGSASGSFTLSHTPMSFGNGTLLYLHINMSPIDQEADYSPYASSEIAIDILANDDS